MSMLRPILLLSAVACASDPVATHLAGVEADLRAADVSHLTDAQRQRRSTELDRLRTYWQRGEFPHNHIAPAGRPRDERPGEWRDQPGQAPVFVDEHGTHCAVAWLMADEVPELVAAIAASDNLATVRDLDGPALRGWADAAGLSIDELARIQPHYDFQERPRGKRPPFVRSSPQPVPDRDLPVEPGSELGQTVVNHLRYLGAETWQYCTHANYSEPHWHMPETSVLAPCAAAYREVNPEGPVVFKAGVRAAEGGELVSTFAHDMGRLEPSEHGSGGRWFRREPAHEAAACFETWLEEIVAGGDTSLPAHRTWEFYLVFDDARELADDPPDRRKRRRHRSSASDH
jgi:hypothetical protein